jgi:transposase
MNCNIYLDMIAKKNQPHYNRKATSLPECQLEDILKWCLYFGDYSILQFVYSKLCKKDVGRLSKWIFNNN